MRFILSGAYLSGFVGMVLVALLAAAILAGGIEGVSFIALLVRFVHILAAISWVGLILFVNFIQLPAVQEAKDRGPLNRYIVRPVTTSFRHASHLTLATGFVMLVTSGYAMSQWMYGGAAPVPVLRELLLWSGAAGATAMWAIVHAVIGPNVDVILSADASDEAKNAARNKARDFARINLILSLPVTLAMVAAAHSY